jgi:hypothetical protein
MYVMSESVSIKSPNSGSSSFYKGASGSIVGFTRSMEIITPLSNLTGMHSQIGRKT